MGLLNSVEVF